MQPLRRPYRVPGGFGRNDHRLPPLWPANGVAPRGPARRTIAVLILALGGVGLRAAFNIAKKRAADRNHPLPPVAVAPTNAVPAEPDDPATKAGFRVSAITLEKEKKSGTTVVSSLVHAVGTVTNPSAKRRFGVRVELDLLDAANRKIGTATDYASVIEPNSEWRFNALVLASKAASAKLAVIKEDQ